MLKRIYIKLLHFYANESNKSEDRKILDFLKKENTSDKRKSYIEIGAGLGRFVKIVYENFNFDMSAVEINEDLAASIKQK
jgi:16S rRNA A1518/A1519 N6-dimethyltransferase RsmA/KsgA/DIM1 with predicted DNA glycosylase/AP lyase activity